MYYVTAHYDVIYYIYHRRKCHFEEIVDSYKTSMTLLYALT